MNFTNLLNAFRFARAYKKPVQNNKIAPQTQVQTVFSELNDRCLLSIEGKDIKKTIQGLITNDIDNINQKRTALYTGFLNARGSLVADAILMQPRVFTNRKLVPKIDEYWIDVHKDIADRLVQHISRNSPKQVLVSHIQDSTKICVVYNDPEFQSMTLAQTGQFVAPPQGLRGLEGSYGNISFVDPRTPLLGIRMIMDGSEYNEDQFNILPKEQYNSYELINSICQSQTMMDKAPFQFNLDLLKGFSFTKRGYLGSELVIKSYLNGIVRKRVFPFVRTDDSVVEVGSSLSNQSTQLGKVLQYNPETGGGMVLLDYLDMEPFQHLEVAGPVKLVILNPLHTQMDVYLKAIKEREKLKAND